MDRLKNLKAYVDWPSDFVRSTDVLFGMNDKLNMPLIDTLILYLNENYDKDIDPMYGYHMSNFKWSRCPLSIEDGIETRVRLECDVSGVYYGNDIDCHVSKEMYILALIGDTIEDAIRYIVRDIRCEYESMAYEEMKRIEKATAWQN